MKLLASAGFAGALFLAAGSAGATTIFTEDFSGYSPSLIAHGAQFAVSTSGNTITTDYSYRVPGNGNTASDPDSMYDQGTWTIGTNPFDVHNLWVNVPSDNPFLMLNGSTNDTSPPPTAYESGAIAVGPGTYSYSYDLLNLCCNANGPTGVPSFLQLWYFANGSSTPINVDTTVSTQAAANGWEQVSGVFTIGEPGGFIRLGLSDTTSVFSGNDFGVDNITLASAPEPATWAMMILGFAGLGASLRQRRRALA